MIKLFNKKKLESLINLSEGSYIFGMTLLKKYNFNKEEIPSYVQMIFEYDDKKYGIEFFCDWDKSIHWDVVEDEIEAREMLETKLTLTNYEYK